MGGKIDPTYFKIDWKGRTFVREKMEVFLEPIVLPIAGS